MRLLALLSLALVLIGLGAPAQAAETPESVADAVCRADAKGDAEAVGDLARSDHPDPWLVADVLDGRGERDVAVRFAGAAPRKDVESLAGYLAAAPKPAALAKARVALAKGEVPAALAALAAHPGAAETITAVRIHFARGDALRADGQAVAAVEAYDRSAQLARKIGWLTMASRALVACGRALWGRDFARAHACFEGQLEVERLLDSDMGMGRAHYFLHLTGANLRRDGAEVMDSLKAAHDLAAASGDAEYLARTLGTLTRLSPRPPREKLGEYCRAADALTRVTGAGLASRFQPDQHLIARDRVGLLLDCASTAQALGDEKIARTHARQAIKTAARDENTELTLSARAFLATVEASLHEQSDRNAEALARLEAARSLYAELPAKYGRDLARVLQRLASLHVRMGHLPRAQALIEEALKRFADLRAAPDRCRALLLAAKIDLNMGRSREARQRLAEAEALAKALRDARLQAEVLIGQAQIHRTFARMSRAKGLLLRARDMPVASQSGLLKGLIHLRLSQLQREMGSTADAVESVEVAIDVLSRTKHVHVARQAREQHASLLVDQGRYEEAYTALTRLLAERQTGKDDLGMATAYVALADVRFVQGRAAKAKAQRVKRSQQARRLREQALELYLNAKSLRKAAVARSQLGRELYLAGEHATAFQQMLRAFDECNALGHASAAATCAHGLAEAFMFEEDWGAAMDWCERCLDLASDYGLDLAEGEGEAARARLGLRYKPGARAAFRAGDAERLHHFFDRGRSAVLLAALGGREALREARVPADLRAKEEVARAAVVLAYEEKQKLVASQDMDARRAANDALEAAQTRLRKAVGAIRSAVRRQADLAYPSVASLADLRRRLGKTDAFVSYGEVDGALVAVVLTSKAKHHVKLGRLEDVRAAVQRLLADVEDVPSAKVIAAVRKLLLDKLPLDGTIKRLLISPHGTLAYVPFSLLDRKREICFLPSATVYVALRDQEDKEDTPGRHILALGDPDYRSAKPGVPPRHTDLPASGDEVKAITEIKRGDVRLLRGEASETGFKEALAKKERWRAVHLACHGIVDAEHPRDSSLALALDPKSDGYLQAMEVFNLEVPADLVVLSGCSTGRGEVIEGEGLEGLTRAFMFAGAPRVIASLWDVGDEATQALMEEFYRRWRGKDAPGAAAALKAAQEYVRTHPKHPEWKAPEYWAAWVLWGLPD